MSTIRDLIKQERRRLTSEPDFDPQHFERKLDASLTRVAEAAAREGTRLGIAVTNSVSDPYMEVENIVNAVLGETNE